MSTLQEKVKGRVKKPVKMSNALLELRLDSLEFYKYKTSFFWSLKWSRGIRVSYNA